MQDLMTAAINLPTSIYTTVEILNIIYTTLRQARYTTVVSADALKQVHL